MFDFETPLYNIVSVPTIVVENKTLVGIDAFKWLHSRINGPSYDNYVKVNDKINDKVNDEVILETPLPKESVNLMQYMYRILEFM